MGLVRVVRVHRKHYNSDLPSTTPIGAEVLGGAALGLLLSLAHVCTDDRPGTSEESGTAEVVVMICTSIGAVVIDEVVALAKVLLAQEA